MKVETPQILWNSEGDKSINAALNSISMLESGLSDHANGAVVSDTRKYGNVMATAGNTHIINLWKLSFACSSQTTTSDNTGSNGNADNNNNNHSSSSSGGIFQKQSTPLTKIDYLCSLTRQEQAVNTVAFSPDGLHLATGGETGAIVVWSVPLSKRGNGNGRHYWSTVEREQDLTVRIVCRSGEGVCDISWSADSKRFIAGTIDHCVFVCEDKNYDANHRSGGGGGPPLESDWEVVYRNNYDHTQYVQGVAYDPLGVYLASMGSDRTVRVFPRKTPPKSKKKVLRPANGTSGNISECVPPLEHQRMVDQLLTDSKLEISKSKVIKYRRSSLPSEEDDNNNDNSENGSVEAQSKPQRRNLYADESTLQSFFRRLSWTTDGAFLVTPGALWHADQDDGNTNETASSSFATYLFARHKFDEPYKVLSGLEKPSLCVRPCPVLFKLPSGSSAASATPKTGESKENQSPTVGRHGLSYRSVFAVLATDSILIYDTHHTRPLSVVRGLHYAGLSDCQWSTDGTQLVVSSIDGYISIVSFENGELGEIYRAPTLARLPVGSPSTLSSVLQQSSPLQCQDRNNAKNMDHKSKATSTSLQWSKPSSSITSPLIPPCEPGQCATLEAPPTKRAKKTRITPTLISAPDTGVMSLKPTLAASPSALTEVKENSNSTKRRADDTLECETHTVGEAVTKLTLENEEKPKKKKRIQPMLVSTGN